MSDIINQYRIEKGSYYRTVSDQVAVYEAACSARIPMILKGSAGRGKTRLIEYMAWTKAFPSGCRSTQAIL